MKTITYLFWRLYKWVKGKEEEEVAFSHFINILSYFFTLLISGGITYLIISFKYDILGDLFKSEGIENKTQRYLLFILTFIICSIPFIFIFPKKKIENLNYTKEERKKYRNNSLYILLGLVVLLALRVIYVRSMR